MAKERDQEFLEYVIKALVSYPDDVKVDRKVDEMGVLLTLKVNPADVGQVIGKQGSTAKAIRTLMRIIGLKNKSRVNLKIDAPMLNKPSEGMAPSSSDSSDDFKI
jgi:uncharacterized protein